MQTGNMKQIIFGFSGRLSSLSGSSEENSQNDIINYLYLYIDFSESRVIPTR